ncbi:hypothetical protein LTR17_015524 [Elasticomyces elasticus]|nr:hypothetical protein LTR17_015524 [Elasticomyces elasticus]
MPHEVSTATIDSFGVVASTAVLGSLDDHRMGFTTRTTPEEIPIAIIVYQGYYDANRAYQYSGFDRVAEWLKYLLGHPTNNSVALRMYEKGCLTNDEHQNCTAVCADPAAVWGHDLKGTLANCMTYPIIASALGHGVNVTLRTGGTSFESISERENIPFPTDGSMYGIIPDAGLDLNTPAAWSVINQCTTAYCEAGTEDNEECNLTDQMVYKSNWRVGDFLPALHFNTTLCNGVEASVNPDLGGVGMVIAYLIQISFVLAGWMLNVFSEAGTAAFVYGATLGGRRRPRAKALHCWAKRMQHYVRHSRHSAALNATLVEFQKTQAFFMLAVVIAALQAVHNAKYLEISTWIQLGSNSNFIATVALSGSYPVTLNLIMLRRTARTSSYILSVSACCAIVSSALWLYNRAHTPSQDDFSFSKTKDLTVCGNSSPRQTCNLGTLGSTTRSYVDISYGLDQVFGVLEVWLFPLIVLAFLVADEATLFTSMTDDKKSGKLNVFDYLRRLLEQSVLPAPGLSRTPWYRRCHAPDGTPAAMESNSKVPAPYGASWLLCGVRHIMSVPITARGHYHRLRNIHLNCTLRRKILTVMNNCYIFIPALAELGLVGMNTMLLVRYVCYQRQYGHAFWSLGQIISVTIWVPVGIEYLYLLAFGIEEGFEYRLKSPYHVRRDADAENGVESSTEDEESTDIDATLPMVGSTSSSLHDDSDDIEMSASISNTDGPDSTGMPQRSMDSMVVI